MTADHSEPVILLGASIALLSGQPLLGILGLSTNQGVVQVALNEEMAERLLKACDRFLCVEDADAEET